MNRRESLKFIGVGSITAGMILGSCRPDLPEQGVKEEPEVLEAGRQDFEIERDRKLLSEQFFTEHEMATIAVLADIIIPADEKSGSATEAGVPDFIEFIVKDIPEHQVPMRGGLKWLDAECLKRFEKAFVDCSEEEQLQVVDDIAYPNKVKPGMEQGAAFFNRMRDLTATGFFTSEIGLQDLEYMGNRPGTYQGVPPEVLKDFGLENDDWG
ncbi:MAG: gluconate 2-dehydrogenase subunit 3 family protein [Saprospiraceae bacterium]